ncbi:hypothetical protein IFR04_014020 [Cadophora malorum]|uniref:GATA-type domain-containing protein n=1 Tax=Cadophora malorum TaxID=108018 RepID=A0A8H7T5W1_9HELO|nr:hypothetical protein IFR04_014020 [Cadophora malorum]
MEKLDGSTRQSAIHSIINREKVEYINNDRPYSTSSTMAATAVVSSASSMYSQPPPPYTWGGPAPSLSGLISPPESRRTSDNKTEPPPPIQTSQAQRQSLPSIHEALNGPKPNQYTSPVSAIPPSQQYPQQQQGPQIPRSFPPPEHSQYSSQAPLQSRQPSPPQPVHPQSIPFSRPEQGPNPFSETPRHPSLTAPPAPHNPYAPRYEQPRYEQDPRTQERAATGYQHPPPPQPYNYGPGPSPMQPAGPQQVFTQPRYAPQNPREMKEWPPQEKTEVFREGLKRHLEVYDFENSLAQINKTSGTIQNWSAHYNAIAQEQQQSVNIIPDRMPTLESVDEMIRHNESITNYLQEMKAMIYEQAQHTAHQRMREQGGRGPGEYDDDGMYDEMKGHGGYGPESKKRRGRAAPPGRCHSCNRAETPEWRRGPDGARTLCNACGLHYAKLTRKNTMKNSQGSNGSNLIPMSKDGLSPRPM